MKNGRNKGSAYERHIAKKLGEWWGEKFQRTPASGGLDWGKDNRVCGDIVTPPDSSFPFTVECKKRESWNMDSLFKGSKEVEKWWVQVKGDCEKSDLFPMVVFSRNLQPDYILMRHRHWHEIHHTGRQIVVPPDRIILHIDMDEVVVLRLDDFTNLYTPDMVVDSVGKIEEIEMHGLSR